MGIAKVLCTYLQLKYYHRVRVRVAHTDIGTVKVMIAVTGLLWLLLLYLGSSIFPNEREAFNIERRFANAGLG